MKALRIAALVVFIAAAFGSLVIGAGAIAYLARSLESLSNARSIFDELYTQQAEAGVGYAPLRPDDPFLLTRRILITEEINERIAKNVVERLFFLDSLDPISPIDLYISSQGGWGDSAFTIIDAMNALHAPVNTHAIGGCYSAGTLILVAGTGKRSAFPSAVISVHVNNDEAKTEDEFSQEPLIQRREERLFRRAARLPEDWYPMLGEDHYYLSPEKALELGVIDEIEGEALAEGA